MSAWPCDNYVAPVTCLSAPASPTGRCLFCSTMATLAVADKPAGPAELRPASMFAICAGEPCDFDAKSEILHTPGDGQVVWVPLCDFHIAAAEQGSRIEYIVELHGFVDVRTSPAGGDA